MAEAEGQAEEGEDQYSSLVSSIMRTSGAVITPFQDLLTSH